jgi:hypothetical protein
VRPAALLAHYPASQERVIGQSDACVGARSAA